MKSISLNKILRVFFGKVIFNMLIVAIALLFVISVVSVLFS
ncbi:MAG: hypothetical protein NW226_01755 [Microscillaceae bacterium]|nr:hypothetical protein [Microscillaceae bacterium]